LRAPPQLYDKWDKLKNLSSAHAFHASSFKLIFRLVFQVIAKL
jgi:hypothetical protein